MPYPHEGLPDRGKVPQSVSVLNGWVNQASTKTGTGPDRLSWLLASSIVIAVLQRAEHTDKHPRFLLKGGAMLEMRLGLGTARATKDIDLLFRGSFDDFVTELDAALGEPWGVLELSRTPIEEVVGARRLVKPRRFNVKLSIRGRVWRNIKVEVAADEGRAGADAESVDGVPLQHFGLPSTPGLAVLVLDYQVAQKLHAVTDPDEPGFENDRVRDIIDLTLIRDAAFVNEELASLRDACHDIFRARASEALELGHQPRSWPPVIAPHERWRAEYRTMAARHGIETDLDLAVGSLNSWIASIESAGQP